MPPIYAHRNIQQIQWAEEDYLIEKILHNNIVFFKIITTTSYAFLLVVRTCMPFLLKSALVEVTHSFTPAMTTPLLGKCCPHSLYFIRPNRSKPEGIKGRLYSGYSRTAQPRTAMCSMIFRLVRGLALSRCRERLPSSPVRLWRFEPSVWSASWHSSQS